MCNEVSEQKYDTRNAGSQVTYTHATGITTIILPKDYNFEDNWEDFAKSLPLDIKNFRTRYADKLK